MEIRWRAIAFRSFITCIISLIIILPGYCAENYEEELEPESCPTNNFYSFKENGVSKKLQACYQSNRSQNGYIQVYLEHKGQRKAVLSTQGNGVTFSKNNKVYPDINISWHMSAEDNPVTQYVWNGQSYEHKDKKRAKSLSIKALQLFKNGNIDDAISLWESAIELGTGGLTAEDYNNIGYAYHQKAKSSNNSEHFEEARKHLETALDIHPNRWVAHLNMADLLADQNEFLWAINHYKTLLKLKPDYKHAADIKEKITALIAKPDALDTEIVSFRYPSGAKDITYIRKDAHTVIRRGHTENGDVRFEEKLIDGQVVEKERTKKSK